MARFRAPNAYVLRPPSGSEFVDANQSSAAAHRDRRSQRAQPRPGGDVPRAGDRRRGVSSLNVALPDVARSLHATLTQLQWIIDAYAVVFAGLLLLAGAIGDRIGRRPVLLAGLCVFSLASASALLVNSAGGLIAVRAVMGSAPRPSCPRPWRSHGRYPRASAMVRVSSGRPSPGSALLGYSFRPPLEAFSWDSVFGFSCALGALALLGALRFAPNSTADEAALDLVGGTLSVFGLSSLVYGIIEGPERGWTDPDVAAFGAALVLLGAFILWELRRGSLSWTRACSGCPASAPERPRSPSSSSPSSGSSS